MENDENFLEIFDLSSDEVAGIDFQTELFDKLDTIIENQSDISEKLDVAINGLSAISYALYTIIAFAILVAAFKILWTFLAKWLFGGI